MLIVNLYRYGLSLQITALESYRAQVRIEQWITRDKLLPKATTQSYYPKLLLSEPTH
ncbi:hypothetical protein LYNGBM3L_26380 [Moorena producens 3L]|uniref:Uncharacterized protein n=1 Tax=Moorena producens 3L TaxID=489825 RepID=F4XSV9_9CYAN|nr:hypothetical protein LYNGBM3L_26380 [Moorena producens 3L]